MKIWKNIAKLHQRRSQRGMTIVEVMIAGVILAIVVGILIMAFEQIKKRQRYMATQQTQIWAVNHLVEQVKSLVAFRPNANAKEPATTMEAALTNFQTAVQQNPEQYMPIVWSYDRIESSQDSAAANLALCPHCKGRLGYWVMPLQNFPGHVLTIAISHPDIFMQTEEGDKKVDNIVYKQFVLGSG